MTYRKNFVFTCLHIIAWLIFVGLSIEAGALVVNFFFSIYNPEFVSRLYQKLDLSTMYDLSRIAFFGMYSFILTIAILKAYLFYLVIMLLSKLDLLSPFNSFVASQITKISFYTLCIGLVSLIAREISNNLTHKGFEVDTLDQFWGDSQAFIIMAAIVYVIATIFSRGVEIQNENDLTV